MSRHAVPPSSSEQGGRRAARAIRHRLGRFTVAMLAVLAALGASLVAAQPASAQENPYERGPDPTRESVAASRGTFATASVNVPGGNGFTDGTIYYPTDTSQGTFGAVAFVPGYNGSWDALEWTGPWLASFGFVVIGFESINPGDGDSARGTQLLAALDYLIEESPVRDRVDPDRTAVIGHSMGGGGAMSAATRRPSLDAAIGLAPAIFSTDMRNLQVPAMLMAARNDTTVTPAYTKNFYNQIPSSTEKTYLELSTGGHGFPSWTPNSAMMRKVIPWLKIFVDKDTRYEQFLCPLMDWTGIAAYQGTCPLSPGTPPSGPVVNGATYKVKNLATGTYLDSEAAGALTLAESSSFDDQDWIFTQQANGSWTIKNARTGRNYLDTEASNAVIWNDGFIGADSQWRVETVTGGVRLENDRTDRGYLHGASDQVRWNAGSADDSTVWVLERQ